MSMMVSFVLSFFPRDVLDEIFNLIESVSEDFPSYSFRSIVVLLVGFCYFCESSCLFYLRFDFDFHVSI